MSRKKRVYEDDDGRTLADMSGISRQNLLVPRMPDGEKKPPVRESENPERAPEQPELTREERRWYVQGALKASLLIGLVYAVGIALVIVLLLLLWNH